MLTASSLPLSSRAQEGPQPPSASEASRMVRDHSLASQALEVPRDVLSTAYNQMMNKHNKPQLCD